MAKAALYTALFYKVLGSALPDHRHCCLSGTSCEPSADMHSLRQPYEAVLLHVGYLPCPFPDPLPGSALYNSQCSRDGREEQQDRRAASLLPAIPRLRSYPQLRKPCLGCSFGSATAPAPYPLALWMEKGPHAEPGELRGGEASMGGPTNSET